MTTTAAPSLVATSPLANAAPISAALVGDTSATSATAILTKRWTGLWKKLGVTAAPDVAPLLAAYGAADRHYHNVSHLQACLAVYDRNPMKDPMAELAIWTHDVVHDPRRTDNETASVALCRQWFENIMPAAHLDTLGNLILVTRHDSRPEWMAAQVVVDADLAVLASEPQAFAAYEQQVRAEYAHVDDAAWRKGRLDMLSRFVNRPRIFITAWFFEQFEVAARKNLNQAIQRLTSQSRA